MRHNHYHPNRAYRGHLEREHHPMVSIGIFFVVLGISLLIATNDLLHLGSIESYFTWQTAMIFIGALLLLNLRFMGGLLLIAGGIWFVRDQIYILSPEDFRLYYWPAVIGLIGISFIISSLFRRKTKIDN